MFFGPSDRNELYQPHYYPKYEVWAIEFFCGRIPLRLHMDPMCKNGMSWPLTCRRILSWILPRRDNTSPCRKHKLTWMENTTGTIKRLIVYRKLLPFLPIWPELRYGIHFDISFVILGPMPPSWRRTLTKLLGEDTIQASAFWGKTMKNQPGTMKNLENRPETMKIE